MLTHTHALAQMHCGDGCYEYQSSWPPSIFSSVLDSLRSYTTQNVCLPPYDISLMPCVCLFASYFEQQHQCRTCQCRRVNKPRDFRAFTFLRQRLVPAPVDGGAETCCALGFLVHIASNSANSKQEMKDEVWMRQDKRWEATLGLMRVARLRALRVTVAAWGASVLYRCWTPFVWLLDWILIQNEGERSLNRDSVVKAWEDTNQKDKRVISQLFLWSHSTSICILTWKSPEYMSV